MGTDLEYARGYVAGMRAAIDTVETSEALDQDLGRPPRSEGLLRALCSALDYAERAAKKAADDAHSGEQRGIESIGHTPSKGIRQ
jgi:hypothetical protein